MDLQTRETTTQSATKTEPLCPVFGVCGGCAYQNIVYEDEIQLKQNRLKQLFLSAFPENKFLIRNVVRSPLEYHYRHRLDLGIYRLKSGEFILGFMDGYKKHKVPIESCVIARKEISDFIPELKKQAIKIWPPKYQLANIAIRTDDSGRVMWGGIGKGSLQMKEEDYLWTRVDGKKIYFSMESFFQSNLSILEPLIQTIKNLKVIRNNTLFFDLYSGVGFFGLCFSNTAQKIIMIEESIASAQLAKFNIEKLVLGGKIQFYQGKVEDFLPVLSQSHPEMHKVAIIDPPRKGLHENVCRFLARPAEASFDLDVLLYLSCSPESLIRDLKTLTAGDWKIGEIIPFDFFPKTEHLEVLAVLHRKRN